MKQAALASVGEVLMGRCAGRANLDTSAWSGQEVRKDVSGLKRLPSRAGKGFAGSLFQYSRVLAGGPWGLVRPFLSACAHFSIMCYSPPRAGTTESAMPCGTGPSARRWEGGQAGLTEPATLQPSGTGRALARASARRPTAGGGRRVMKLAGQAWAGGATALQRLPASGYMAWHGVALEKQSQERSLGTGGMGEGV